MRDFQNAYPNDRYDGFDRRYACWAQNHNGWRKAKKKWRRIGKKRMRRETKKTDRGRNAVKLPELPDGTEWGPCIWRRLDVAADTGTETRKGARKK